MKEDMKVKYSLLLNPSPSTLKHNMVEYETDDQSLPCIGAELNFPIGGALKGYGKYVRFKVLTVNLYCGTLDDSNSEKFDRYINLGEVEVITPCRELNDVDRYADVYAVRCQ